MNRLHPLSAVTTALQKGFVGLSIPFFLMGALSAVFDSVDPTWSIYLVPVGFVGGVAYGIAYYYRFEYELTRDTFDLASGVLSRRDREIPFRRVQNVDVRQGIVQQLLGVAIVTIETAGGGDTEATLNFVTEEEANRLQREIRRLTAESTQRSGDTDDARHDTAVEPADDGLGTKQDRPRQVDSGGESSDSATRADVDTDVSGGRTGTASSPQLLFELSHRELLLYSFASFSIAAAAGVLFFGFFLSDSILEFLRSVAQPLGGPDDLASASPQEYGIFGVISLAHGIVATYLVGAAYTFLGYYDFRLGRAGEDLVYERGLLQRYSGSIPIEKIQAVTITDNPLQRAIGYAGLWIETAGYGPESAGGSQSAVPLARSNRIYWFAERLTGLERPSFDRPTSVARRRYLGRYSIVAGAIVALSFGVSQFSALERWWLAFAIFLVVPPAAHLRWVNLGYDVGDEHLVIRSGFWRRRTTVVPYYRVQTISTRRSIFQRRLGLASLVVDTASSRTFFWATPTIYDLEVEVAREIHDRSRERLQSALADRSAGSDEGVSVAFS